MTWSAAFANAPPLHPHTLTAAPSSWRLCNDWRHRDYSNLVRVERFHCLVRPRSVRLGVRQQSGHATAGDAGESGGEEEETHRDSCSSLLDNPRLPVPNEYLAGWALTQNDTACLKRLQDTMPTRPVTTAAASSSSTSGDSSLKSGLAVAQEGSGERGGGFWGDTTLALMDRVDITRDVDQRRLATSCYWQRLQEKNSPAASSVDDEAGSSLSWEDVSSKFEQDSAFVRREKERLLEEAATGIPEGWRGDRTSRAWVASYRLSVFETRRQAQLFFSWAIPDEGALDCILEPGKRVLEVGSGLGYWASLLKIRSGDDSRVHCLDPYAPEIQVVSNGGGDSSAVEATAAEQKQNPSSEAEVDDVWFSEGRAPFAAAERGSFEKIAEHPELYRGWSLLVCWPSDGEWPEGCLRAFGGDEFFYVGEAEGGATRMPWRLLREDWELERRVEIPRWPGFKDALWWYRRRGAAPWPPVR